MYQFFEYILRSYSETHRQSFETLHYDLVTESRLAPVFGNRLNFRELSFVPTVRDKEPDFMSPNAFRLCVVDRSTTDQQPQYDMRLFLTTLDYNSIRSLITRCGHIDKDTCGIQTALWTKPLEHFHLIHCESRRVISVPGPCEYVALSYVRGKLENRLGESATQSTFPPTIENAIEVTIHLGFSYLCVDRYCINEENETHKTSQIQQMGQIYNQASLTIIAAAGADPSYGLPGVSRARTYLSGAAVFDLYEYVPNPANPIPHVRGSVWATRGWTYQEAFLSRRRLFFNDAQLLFECGNDTSEEIAFCEVLDISIPRESVQQRERVHRTHSDTNLESLIQSICDYSTREVGYVQDRLRAFLGILASYAATPTPIYHLWGVLVGSNYGARHIYLASWEFRPSNKIPEFPSWSWLGWMGRMSLSPNSEDLHPGPSVRVEVNGRAVDLSPTLLQRYYSVENDPGAAPTVLQLESTTFPIYAPIYAVDVKHVPVHKVRKLGLNYIRINVNAVPDMARIPHWVSWQDQSSRWVYAGYEVLDRSFIGGLDENGKTDLLGVTIIDGVGYRKCSILRPVAGGYETVG